MHVFDGLPNPYWEGIQALVQHGWAHIYKDRLTAAPGRLGDLLALGARFSPVIPDPLLIAWLVSVVGRAVVEVDAHTAYWSWMLSLRGVSAVAFDRVPPWTVYYPVERSGRERTELRSRDMVHRTLLGVMPRNFRLFQAALDAFPGNAFVVMSDDLRLRAAPDAFFGPYWTWIESRHGVCLVGHPVAAHLYRRAKVRGKAPAWASQTMLIPQVGT